MSKVTLWAARGEYLEHLKAQGAAQSTIRNHAQVIDHAMNTWGDIDMRDIGPAEITTYFARRSWSVSTTNLYLRCLRAFLAWCRSRQIMPIDVDPTAGWKSRKPDRRPRTWLTLDEMQQLLDAAWCPRDRAVIALGAFAMLRGSETCALRVRDVDLEHGELRIWRRKTRETDSMPICVELEDELRAWLAAYQAQCGRLDPDWLLVPARGPIPMTAEPGTGRLHPTGEPAPLKPLSPITKPHEVVRRAMRDIGLDRIGDGAHVLRRSSAQLLLEQLSTAGVPDPLRRVSSMLGHRSVETTEIYLNVDNARRARNELLRGHQMFTSDHSSQRRAA